MNAERGCQADDVSQTDVSLAAFNPTHICSMDAGLGSERLLAQATVLAQRSNSCPELRERAVRHAHEFRALNTMSLHPMSSVLATVLGRCNHDGTASGMPGGVADKQMRDWRDRICPHILGPN